MLNEGFDKVYLFVESGYVQFCDRFSGFEFGQLAFPEILEIFYLSVLRGILRLVFFNVKIQSVRVVVIEPDGDCLVNEIPGTFGTAESRTVIVF